MKNLKELGQFFTPEIVAKYMVNLSGVKKDDKILEPSCGEGIFLKCLEENGFNNITAYEVDYTLNNISNTKIIYKSFINENQIEKYSLIIGNPPYIRWKNLKVELKEELKKNELWNKYFNSLCDYLYLFILKSIELLEENGELIFITPEYWMHTTHSISLRNYMVEKGYFEKIIHFSETPIFESVNSSIIIFKYIKNKSLNKNIELIEYKSNKKLDEKSINLILNQEPNQSIKYSSIPQFEKNKKWIFANNEIINKFKEYENYCIDENNKLITLKDIAIIGNGMVSGLDKIFQVNFDLSLLSIKEKDSLLKVIKSKNLNSYYHNEYINYIFINENITENDFKKYYPNFYSQLITEKDSLNKRYMYNKDIKYWEWAFLRNYKLFKSNREKIFIPCKERISHKNYFRFSYVEESFFPTQDVTAIYLNDNVKESIFYILALLNSSAIFDWIKYNGIIKGNIVEFSEKPLSSIPIRLINWNDKKEVMIHNKIKTIVIKYIKNKNDDLLLEIEELLNCLFKKWS